MKACALLSKITFSICFGAVLHQFGASFWMLKRTAIPLHTKLATVVPIMLADFLRYTVRIIFVLIFISGSFVQLSISGQ